MPLSSLSLLKHFSGDKGSIRNALFLAHFIVMPQLLNEGYEQQKWGWRNRVRGNDGMTHQVSGPKVLRWVNIEFLCSVAIGATVEFRRCRRAITILLSWCPCDFAGCLFSSGQQHPFMECLWGCPEEVQGWGWWVGRAFVYIIRNSWLQMAVTVGQSCDHAFVTAERKRSSIRGLPVY